MGLLKGPKISPQRYEERQESKHNFFSQGALCLSGELSFFSGVNYE